MEHGYGVLDFRAVDGIGFAAEQGRLATIPSTFRLSADRLGPLLEVQHLQECGFFPAHPHWLDAGPLSNLQSAVSERRPLWYRRGSIAVGVMKVANHSVSNRWTTFAMEAKRAAIGADFDSDWAGQMVAAIREMEDNVREHSGNLESAYLAYRAVQGLFEFVVADHGSGVLSTLREAPEHKGLSSDGEALRAALTEGVSRFGRDKNRGYGYRPLFTGLVNRRAGLRFRSGTGSLTMDGVAPGLPSARIGAKPRASGLFVSVCCERP